MAKTAAQRLGKRVREGETIHIRGSFGDENSFYELEVYGRGRPRPDVHLQVTWCGTHVQTEMIRGTTDVMRAAAAQKAFPVVYRSQHKSFGQALKRYAKCVGNGELPEVSDVVPRFGSVELLQGSDDLLDEAVLAFAETFEVDAPSDLDAARADWSETRKRVLGALVPALDKARADAVEAAEQADQKRAQAAARNLEEALIKRQGLYMAIDTTKTPGRNGPPLDEAKLFAKHADAEKLLLMGDQLGSWLYWLEQAQPEALTTLVVDTYWETMTRTAAVPVGDVSSLLAACPNLTSVFMIGDVAVGKPIACAQLESLTLLADPLGPKTVRTILESPAPALKRLTLGLRNEYGSKADAELAAALNNDALPALEELTIAEADDPAPILQKVMTSGLVARLKALRFYVNDEMRIDACAEYVSENHEAFAHLDQLGLGTDQMFVSPEISDELKAKIPGLGFCDNPFDPSVYGKSAFVPD